MSIDSYRRQLDAIELDARGLLAGIDVQLNWQPRSDRWSIGQCISHLIVSGRAELPLLERAIREGREKRMFGPEPFRYGFLGNWFVRTMDAPVRMKFKAPKVYRPSTDRFAVDALSADFLALHDEWRTCLENAEGLDLSRIRVSTPVTRFITFSLGQEFALILAHERRHVWQARRIKEGFA
jgi:hypothetical protein